MLQGYPEVAIELSLGEFSLEPGTYQVMVAATFRTLDHDPDVENLSKGSHNMEDVITAINAVIDLKNSRALQNTPD